MTLTERITQDLKSAMKAKDQVALRSIRAIKAEILLKKTDGSGQELNSDDEITILQKLVKQRKDSLDIFEEQGREDLAEVERQEIEVISRYLPDQLSLEEIELIIQEVISSTGAQSMKDMGKVMGQARARLAGRADNKIIALLVKKSLS